MTHTLLKSKDIASPLQDLNHSYVVPASLGLWTESQNTTSLSFSALLVQNSYQLPSLGLSSLPSPDFSKLLSSFLSRTSLGDNYEIVP